MMNSLSDLIKSITDDLEKDEIDHAKRWRDNHQAGTYHKNITFEFQCHDRQIQDNYKRIMAQSGNYKEWGY